MVQCCICGPVLYHHLWTSAISSPVNQCCIIICHPVLYHHLWSVSSSAVSSPVVQCCICGPVLYHHQSTSAVSSPIIQCCIITCHPVSSPINLYLWVHSSGNKLCLLLTQTEQSPVQFAENILHHLLSFLLTLT